MTGDPEGQERDDMHQPLPQGGVGLDEGGLYVLEEHLELVLALHLHGRQETLQGGKMDTNNTYRPFQVG